MEWDGVGTVQVTFIAFTRVPRAPSTPDIRPSERVLERPLMHSARESETEQSERMGEGGRGGQKNEGVVEFVVLVARVREMYIMQKERGYAS